METNERHILVVIGPEPTTPSDPDFRTDLGAFDAVREVTGLGFTRLMNPSYQEFVDHTRRIRVQSDITLYCHIASHMNPSGMQFRDQHVSPDMLSVHLTGMEVLFLAGCESTAIGDLLGVVPHVVTLLEAIDNKAARILGELFWLGIGRGLPPPQAYQAAIKRLPDVAQYAFLHQHGFLAGNHKT